MTTQDSAQARDAAIDIVTEAVEAARVLDQTDNFPGHSLDQLCETIDAYLASQEG